LVQFDPGTSSSAIQQILQQEHASVAQTFYGLDNLMLINLPSYYSPTPVPEMVTLQAATSWSMKSIVYYATPNRVVAENRLIPDDTFFPFQWGLNNGGQTGGVIGADIDARKAWDIYTGSSQTVVAVIDSGVAYNHPDLRDNMWVNPGEIPNNKLDDDGNGYVDDIYGAAPAVAYNNGDPMDFNGHGTHVAGAIGAVEGGGEIFEVL
jgi:subtilisin family serine protease